MPRTRSSTKKALENTDEDGSSTSLFKRPHDQRPPSPDTKTNEDVSSKKLFKGPGDQGRLTTGIGPISSTNKHLDELNKVVQEKVCSQELDRFRTYEEYGLYNSMDILHGTSSLRKMLSVVGPAVVACGEPKLVFEDLQLCIKQVARMIIKPVTWAQLKPEEQKKVLAWAPKAERLMDSTPGRRAIFQAWLWHLLDDMIFSANPSTKWPAVDDTWAVWPLLGQPMSIFQQTFDSGKIDSYETAKLATQFHVWRALSSELAGKVTGSTTGLPLEYITKVIKDELGHLIEYDEIADDVLLRTSEMVQALETEITRSRAKLSIRWDEQGRTTGFPLRKDRFSHERGVPPMVPHELVDRHYEKPAPDYRGEPVELVTIPAFVFHGRNLNLRYSVASWEEVECLCSLVGVVGEIPGPSVDDHSEDDDTEKVGKDINPDERDGVSDGALE
ncbi:hypothetical protein GGR54DRAFT_643839 [Hypoxylon sp. NC1633]|nr:hypothetical protein GGR54DRAFT_643839 [Hypoxylon sp. NC1633]